MKPLSDENTGPYDAGLPGWHGIILVANTPFSDDGSLDLGSIPGFADYLADAGCEAALLRGVAAETAFLDASERQLLVRSFAEATRGRFDLIVGLSVNGLHELTEETRAALGAGASAINWRPAAGTDATELIATLLAIEKAGATKIMLQDFDIAGAGLTDEAILAAHREVEAFCSIKVETNDNLAKSDRLAAGVQRPINLCAGWPVTGMIASFDAGIDGFMPTGLAPLLQHIYRLHRDGSRPRAVDLFERLSPLHDFMSESLGRSIVVNKLLRKHEGIFTTDRCRHPEAVLGGENRRTGEQLIEAAVAVQAEACRS